jgi:RimJ/RimL family protein N-acetyltransferase
MIRLEYFGKEDFAQLISWINSEELMMNWSGSMFSFPLTEASLNWYIEDVNDLTKSEAFLYKAVEVETGKVVGHISLGGISKKNKSARISRVIIGDESAKGKGYGAEMVKAVLQIGFEDLHLHRIALGVYNDNIAAIKTYQKAGMQIEGVTRECLWFNMKWWSLVEMSILEEEWDKMK